MKMLSSVIEEIESSHLLDLEAFRKARMVCFDDSEEAFDSVVQFLRGKAFYMSDLFRFKITADLCLYEGVLVVFKRRKFFRDVFESYILCYVVDDLVHRSYVADGSLSPYVGSLYGYYAETMGNWLLEG